MIRTEISISVNSMPSPNGNDLYCLTADHGSLDAIYYPNPGWMGISGIDVEVGYRRQGIAKALLRECLAIAEEREARLVYGPIVSRECLEAMRAVFGTKALDIENEGSYEDGSNVWPQCKTLASLCYRLD